MDFRQQAFRKPIVAQAFKACERGAHCLRRLRRVSPKRAKAEAPRHTLENDV